jgi:hypothetical protein
METLCPKQLCFERLFHKEVSAAFEGGRITSDAGKVKHQLLTLVRQRLFASALG